MSIKLMVKDEILHSQDLQGKIHVFERENKDDQVAGSMPVDLYMFYLRRKSN